MHLKVELHDGFCGWAAVAYLLQWLDGRGRKFLGLGTKIPGVNHHVGDHGLTNHDLSVIMNTAGYKHYH